MHAAAGGVPTSRGSARREDVVAMGVLGRVACDRNLDRDASNPALGAAGCPIVRSELNPSGQALGRPNPVAQRRVPRVNSQVPSFIAIQGIAETHTAFCWENSIGRTGECARQTGSLPL